MSTYYVRGPACAPLLLHVLLLIGHVAKGKARSPGGVGVVGSLFSVAQGSEQGGSPAGWEGEEPGSWGAREGSRAQEGPPSGDDHAGCLGRGDQLTGNEGGRLGRRVLELGESIKPIQLSLPHLDVGTFILLKPSPEDL